MADTRRLVVTLSTDLIALEANNASRNQFLNVPGSVSAEKIISTACERWQIDAQDHNNYCLIFDDTKKYLSEGKDNNVTI